LGQDLGALGILNPLAEFGETATPKSDYLTPNRVV
jgi:hypothetical protein